MLFRSGVEGHDARNEEEVSDQISGAGNFGQSRGQVLGQTSPIAIFETNTMDILEFRSAKLPVNLHDHRNHSPRFWRRIH